MGYLGLWLLGVLPVGLGLEVYVISVLLSLVGIHLRVLLGLERIGSFNVLMLFQGCSLLLLMLFIYGVLGVREVRGYIYGIYAVNILSWLVSLLIMLRCFRVLGHADQIVPKSLWVYLREVFAYGLWSGADNMAEGLTARLNYFLVERSVGYGGVGLLDAGTRISEGVRHISQGLSQLSYSATARSREKEEQRLISVGYFRITLYLMSILMLLILLIPEWIYTEYLFTVEFVGIRVLIMCLSLGVLSQGCNCIFSHYFIGTGRVRLSAICSLIGLLSLLLSGSILIPCYGVIGSALSTSISFSMMLIYSLIMFTRITGTTLIELFGLRVKK
jgi:O-antigen/teichoic acid export membrane protein